MKKYKTKTKTIRRKKGLDIGKVLQSWLDKSEKYCKESYDFIKQNIQDKKIVGEMKSKASTYYKELKESIENILNSSALKSEESKKNAILDTMDKKLDETSKLDKTLKFAAFGGILLAAILLITSIVSVNPTTSLVDTSSEINSTTLNEINSSSSDPQNTVSNTSPDIIIIDQNDNDFGLYALTAIAAGASATSLAISLEDKLKKERAQDQDVGNRPEKDLSTTHEKKQINTII